MHLNQRGLALNALFKDTSKIPCPHCVYKRILTLSATSTFCRLICASFCSRSAVSKYPLSHRCRRISTSLRLQIEGRRSSAAQRACCIIRLRESMVWETHKNAQMAGDLHSLPALLVLFLLNTLCIRRNLHRLICCHSQKPLGQGLLLDGRDLGQQLTQTSKAL